MAWGSRVADPRAELERHFLARLIRLAKLRHAWRVEVAEETPELLDFALASTYADCLTLGLRSRTQELLGIVRERDEGCRGIRSG